MEKKLSTEDHLRIQNLDMRAQNIALREALHAREKQDIETEKVALQQDMMNARVDIAKRYEADPLSLRIRKDGMIEYEAPIRELRPANEEAVNGASA